MSAWVRRVLVPLAVAGFVVLAGPGVPAHADAVPYSDRLAVGFITLYDKAGNAVKGGSVKDRPFVWKAVGSKRAPAPYDAPGRKATLFAAQPRQGVPAELWSGDSLTGSTDYPDPAHPTVTAGPKDLSLQDFLGEYPAQWNGLVQLRIYLGVPDAPTRTGDYVTTDIRVSGNTWTVIGGGPGAGPGGANIPGRPGPAGGSSTVDGAGTGLPTTLDGSNPVAAILPALGTPGGLAVAALVIVAFVGAGVFWSRRSRRHTFGAFADEADDADDAAPANEADANEPVKPEPVGSEPVGSEPVAGAPVAGASVGSEPVGSGT